MKIKNFQHAKNLRFSCIMNKKIISLIIAVFLLVNIASVCAQKEVIFVDGTREPTKEPSIPEKTPIGVESQFDTVNIVIDYNRDEKQDAGEPMITMPRIFYENIILDREGTFNADGDLVAQGIVWDIKTSHYTATENEEIIGVFEFNKKGYVYKHYENGEPVYFNGRDAEGHHFEKIPINYLENININAEDFSYDAGERTFTFDKMNARIDNHNAMIISKGGNVVSTTTVNPDTGVTATMNADGYIEIRDADGNWINGFSSGMYDNGEYYSKDGRYSFIPYSEADEGASIFYGCDSDTNKKTKILINSYGDKTYIHLVNDVPCAETIYHSDGSVTTSHNYKHGAPEYYENINKDGWLVSRTYIDTGKTYVVKDDQSIDVYDKAGTFIRNVKEEDAEKSKDKNLKDIQTANEWNRFYTGRGALSKFFGQIMEISDYSALSNALLKGKAFNKYRNKIDKLFSQNYLGVDYWVSAICERDFHRIGDGDVAVIETPTGLVQFIGSIQAEKSAPMPKQCPCAKDETCMGKVCYKGDKMKVEYFYKITYAVTAPSDVKLTPQRKEGSAVSFSIQLTGEKSHWLFVKNKQPYFYELDNGESQSAVGDKAVIFYSSNDYNDIYIIFREKPKDRHGNSVDNIYSTISQSQSSYTNWQASTASGMSDTPDENDVPMLNPEVLE